MLVFFIIIGITIVINIMLYYSTIKIEIENFKIDTTLKPRIKEFNIKIYLSLR